MKGRMMTIRAAAPDHADDRSTGSEQPSVNENQQILKGRLRHSRSEDLQYGQKTRSNIHGSHPLP